MPIMWSTPPRRPGGERHTDLRRQSPAHQPFATGRAVVYRRSRRDGCGRRSESRKKAIMAEPRGLTVRHARKMVRVKFTFSNLPGLAWHEPVGRIVELAQLSEDVGFDRFGV